MSEQHRSSAENRAPETPGRAKLEALVALIQHGSLPVAILVIGVCVVAWLFFMRGPISQLLAGAEAVKIGSFELRLRADADSANLGAQFRALQQLTQAQLQLFLVFGRERESISYVGPELTEENLLALQRLGLLSEVKREPDNSFSWRVSNEGIRLHNIIFSQLYLSIQRSAAAPTR
jgi:hypothetical protein